MRPCTRRRALHVAVAGLAGLAGCNRLAGESASSGSSVESGGARTEEGDTETDPPTVLRRADSEAPPIRPPDFERARSDSPDGDSLSFRAEHLVVDSASTAGGLTADNGEAVSEFVSRTDFDSETLYLETRQVEACYRLRLCSVSWQSEKVRTEYARVLRPYDERCAADTAVFESRLIRLPVSLDADAIHDWPELSDAERADLAPDYPDPIVDHSHRREQALAMYKRARGEDPEE